MPVPSHRRESLRPHESGAFGRAERVLCGPSGPTAAERAPRTKSLSPVRPQTSRLDATLRELSSVPSRISRLVLPTGRNRTIDDGLSTILLQSWCCNDIRSPADSLDARTTHDSYYRDSAVITCVTRGLWVVGCRSTPRPTEFPFGASERGAATRSRSATTSITGGHRWCFPGDSCSGGGASVR